MFVYPIYSAYCFDLIHASDKPRPRTGGVFHLTQNRMQKLTDIITDLEDEIYGTPESGGYDEPQWVASESAALPALKKAAKAADTFRELVSAMRQNQKEYFKAVRTHGREAAVAKAFLESSKDYERQVDDHLSGKGEQTTLF